MTNPPAPGAGRDPARRPAMFAGDPDAVPEWTIAQEAVAASVARKPERWAALGACPAVAIYTDGSTPLRNPGGPAGFAAILVAGAGESAPGAPSARIDLGGAIPARTVEPATSNNRAEIAGVLAALLVLARLGPVDSPPAQVTIWSDSNYVVNCGTGRWQRKKNTDLWPLFDAANEALTAFWPEGVRLEWVKGHAGNRYNQAADELATRAALGFDEHAYARYRAAQEATGQEMPGAGALDATPGASEAEAPAPGAPPPGPAWPVAGAPAALPLDWARDVDYTFVLHTQLEGPGLRGPGLGQYRVWTRDGRARRVVIRHPGPHAVDEAEYLTLIAALIELLGRITTAGRTPGAYRMAIYSHQELLVKQLLGSYRVKAAALVALYAAAQELLGQFGGVELIWKRADDIKPLFR